MQTSRGFTNLILLGLALLIVGFFWLGTQFAGQSSSQQIGASAAGLKPFNLAEPHNQLEDVSQVQPISEKKLRFFANLAPLVAYENARLTWRAQQLMAAQKLVNQQQEELLTAREIKQLEEIAEAYGASWPLTNQELNQLLVKVQPVPADLVLVQAANESAWGSSRFAKQANNLFGQWCFTKGCGLVPSARDANKSHEVRKFAHPLASVQSYMHNLNTHRAYEDLRQRRQQLIAAKQEVTGVNLAPSLLKYSERGQAYVDELLAMLKQNQALIQQAVESVELQPLN